MYSKSQQLRLGSCYSSRNTTTSGISEWHWPEWGQTEGRAGTGNAVEVDLDFEEKKKEQVQKTLGGAETKKAHRGAYGTGGGGGIYKSRIAAFSFLVDLLAEPQGD